jgi:tRNA (guanine-N7-)-methyltransferase
VIKPTFYKSFRSRRYRDLQKPRISTLDVLKKSNNIILDVGFGTGESTISLVNNNPDCLICGVEAYKPGIQVLIKKNILTHYGDALEFLEKIDRNAISKIYMLFPDPWQKRKHRKRRLFNKYTFNIIERILVKKGVFHFASDNINYAIQAKDVIQKACVKKISFSKNRGCRPITKYEKKALAKNKFIFDIVYTKY